MYIGTPDLTRYFENPQKITKKWSLIILDAFQFKASKPVFIFEKQLTINCKGLS